MPPPPIREAAPATHPTGAVGASMAAAFFDDKSSVYLWPDPEVRLEALAWYYGALVPRFGFRQGRVWVAGDGAGQAVWLTDDVTVGFWAGVQAGGLAFLPRFGLPAFRRLLRLEATIEALREACAPPGHQYLLLLGVDPALQGRGVGARLMAPGLDAADRAGRPCYLETSTESNLGYYRAHGFEVVGERRVPDGPLQWGMARPPR